MKRKKNENIYTNANAKPDPFYKVLNDIVLDYLYCKTIEIQIDSEMREMISDHVDKIKQLPHKFSKEKLLSCDPKELYNSHMNKHECMGHFSIESLYDSILQKYGIENTHDQNLHYMYYQYMIDTILHKCF